MLGNLVFLLIYVNEDKLVFITKFFIKLMQFWDFLCTGQAPGGKETEYLVFSPRKSFDRKYLFWSSLNRIMGDALSPTFIASSAENPKDKINNRDDIYFIRYFFTT